MKVLLHFLVITSIATLANTYNFSANSSEFQYQGVSIGGWLVLEPYITPSLFKQTLASGESESDLPVDEYHFCKKLGQEEAQKRLTTHWSTFYNETDFQEIKQHGLNMVRLPIGYWAFEKLDNDPYVSGAQEYLDKAIEWSSKYGLKVLIDLHGAPNSQNGFDNSGLRNIGFPGWQNNTEFVDLTVRVLNQIYEKYGASNYSDVVLGIEVLNEPLGPVLNMTELKSFYFATYNNSREIQEVNNTIFFHDAFQPIGYWDEFFDNGEIGHFNKSLNRTGAPSTTIDSTFFNNLIVDHHHYEVFASSVADNITQHLVNIKNYANSIANETQRAIVGEWSAALTDCAPWLNGIGLGSRYEGTEPYTDYDRVGSCSAVNKNPQKWFKHQKKNYRKFIEMQLYQYTENTSGWIFWCWKTEGGGATTEWDFKQLAKLDIMPQPLDNYKYIKNGVDVSSSSSGTLQSNSVLSALLVMITFIMSVNVAIIGSGVVGSAFIRQLKNLKCKIAFNVVYLAKTSKIAHYSKDYKPVDLANLETAQVQPTLSLDDLVQFLKNAHRPTILVDNTSDETIANYYPTFIKQGISIATPNKKAFSSTLKIWNDIFTNAEQDGAGLVYHESTVGAGLPIIGPLKDLVLTGDKIETIEGIFSGTLSYIFNEFSTPEKSDVKFSDIVKKAKNLGYTEPDPRDDLNGLDVARKVTILARLSGFEVESPTSFPVESLIPKELEGVASASEFLQRLSEFDNEIQKTKDDAFENGKVLRFVGKVDFKNNKVSVEIGKYPFDHSFASLKGSDNVVAIKTERYPNPLIVQGAGAGSEVTAHGVLADTIKIAERIAN
ncbi:exgA [Candida oxycetoniae]|uniref:Homoserine dehydrogenase n=1 Tax=Candida oxycetoniae TaxID=497107 RepID=A0AAI9SVI3_9ASCO|nr:exgA [Candida oxycetoniae]KAI3403846.1 exgA [Candida oxycetoniae]